MKVLLIDDEADIRKIAKLRVQNVRARKDDSFW